MLIDMTTNLLPNKPMGVETRLNNDGTSNTKYVDVLDEDKPIAGQKFACVSFLSPETIVKDKNMFMFQAFLKQWDMQKSLEKFTQFLSFISYKHNIPLNVLTDDMQEFCKTERDNLFTTSLEDEYKTFLDTHEDKLTKEFSETHLFQTSTRGLKIRGSFPTQEEAELRCKMLREVDPNHDVYVGPVGMWMPWHPEAYKTGRVEYIEDELNQLMHEKNNNEKQATIEFEKRVREAKEKAIEENKKKAEDTGNVLTQTIDTDGNLIGVRGMNTADERLGDDVSVADVRKELFEADNIIVDKNNDRGLGAVLANKEKDSNTSIEVSEIKKDE